MAHSKVVLSSGEVLIDLTEDTVEAHNLLKGYTAHGRDGEAVAGTCTYDANTTDATAIASEILSGKTAYKNGAKVTGTMPNRGAVSGSIASKNGSYTIPQGYHDGGGTVSIPATERNKIIPDNIREGVTILGVEGAMNGAEDISAQAKTVTPTFEEQEVLPGAGYNYLPSVTVEAIKVTRTTNTAGGTTVTIG